LGAYVKLVGQLWTLVEKKPPPPHCA